MSTSSTVSTPSALSGLVLGEDYKLTVEPMHLSVTQTCPLGTTSNLHLIANADLVTQASPVVDSTHTGAIVIGLNVDNDHDEVHYLADVDEMEILNMGIAALTLALAAAKRCAGVGVRDQTGQGREAAL